VRRVISGVYVCMCVCVCVCVYLDAGFDGGLQVPLEAILLCH